MGTALISISENAIAEIRLLLVTKKIRVALTNRAAHQASAQSSKHAMQLIDLQRRMDCVVRELCVIHDFLGQMDIGNRNHQVYESWLDELQKVAHVMEDTVDEYLYQVGREYDTVCCFYLKKGLRGKPRSPLSLSQITFIVQQIEEELAHLSQAKTLWVPKKINGVIRSLNNIIKHSQDLANISRSLDEDGLVGVDKYRETLQQWLRDDEAECSVIVLLGMGGLGKTALAENVYRTEREKFQCHAWVSISQTYSREEVLRNIIKELFKDKFTVPSEVEAMDITCLEETLTNFLNQKKYFIILDDVWTPEAFDDLSKTFVRSKKGSKLIITTREGYVAALASRGHILTLEFLSGENAWDLFCKKSFPRETNHECPVELKHLSKGIIRMCKGLPLAIVSIGSLLHVREKNVEEWRRIHDQLSWEIVNNSSLDQIRNVLHLCLIYLPTYLKSCLIYCSLFPEEYLFNRKKLVRLWMAEGFIEERGASTLEEVAEGYLYELVSRNMLQLFERNSVGRIKRFRMHGIIRQLVVYLCQKGHFGVIYEEDKCGGSLQWDERRLVVHKLQKDMDIHQSFYSIHRLRTFIILDKRRPSFTLLPLLCEKSRYMTVIELCGLPFEKIPDAIGDLFNLRHLGLRYSKVRLLPKSIERLSNLLTLDLALSDIEELPRGIVKLKKLRHLFAERATPIQDIRFARGVCIPIGLGNLTNLQTLQALEVQDESSIRHLGELRHLRSLRICSVNEIYCRRICESLAQMPFLSNLCVGAINENEVLVLNTLPTNLQKLQLIGRLAEDDTLLGLQALGQNLYSVNLSWSHLREDPLPSLSQLSNLRLLHLNRAYDGEQLVFSTGWFPNLKNLHLRDLPNLKRLEINQGAMETLESFTLGKLNSMAEVPPGLEFLMPLKYLGFFEIRHDFLMLLRQCPALVGSRWQYTLHQ